MIKIAGNTVEIKHFPDGALLLKEDVDSWKANLNTNSICFEWYFEKMKNWQHCNFQLPMKRTYLNQS